MHPFSPSKAKERSERTTSGNFETTGDSLSVSRAYAPDNAGKDGATSASGILLLEVNVKAFLP